MTTDNQIDRFLRLAALKQEKYAIIAGELDVPRQQLTDWEKEHKAKYQEFADIRQLYKRKEIKGIDINEFYDWYQVLDRECFYCGITEDEIKDLIDKKRIKTKRLKTRGKKLELERRRPNQKYDNLANLTLCCYWCNNAKTDEFTEKEFEKIGKCIAEIWENRMA